MSDLLRVISEKAKAKYNKTDGSTKGYFQIDGKFYHWAWHNGEHFTEGQEVEGRIIEVRRYLPTIKKGHTEIQIVFEPDNKYSPPKYSYEFLENRKVDFSVLGNFIGDCKFCGEKGVVEHTHVMGECPKKHAKEVAEFTKTKSDSFKKFERDFQKK